MMKNLKIEVDDPLLKKYTATTTKGKEYSLEREGWELFLRDDENTLGRILQNDPFGGTIWRGSPRLLGEPEYECLGEYDSHSGEYVVTPYIDWEKRADLRQQIHPLEYLVSAIEKENKSQPENPWKPWPRYLPAVTEDEGQY